MSDLQPCDHLITQIKLTIFTMDRETPDLDTFIKEVKDVLDSTDFRIRFVKSKDKNL